MHPTSHACVHGSGVQLCKTRQHVQTRRESAQCTARSFDFEVRTWGLRELPDHKASPALCTVVTCDMAQGAGAAQRLQHSKTGCSHICYVNLNLIMRHRGNIDCSIT